MSGIRNLSGYAKISNDFFLNRKMLQFAQSHYRAAFKWVVALSYCSFRMSDGLFDDWDNAQYLHIEPDDLEVLVNAGLLDVVNGGYRIHDYEQYQAPSTDTQDTTSFLPHQRGIFAEDCHRAGLSAQLKANKKKAYTSF